jgi:hypothetical protein
VNLDVYAVVLQFADDVCGPGVADVWSVLLEGKAKHCDYRTKNVVSGADHLPNSALGDKSSHSIVDALTGADTTKI